MKVVDKKINTILNNPKLNSKFIFSKHNDLNINCNILKNNFYLDSYNYFPITEEYFCFLEVFTWGEKLKYKNFFSESFKYNFKKNIKNLKSLSNVFVLGSSSSNNYYRNMITFLPRIFFTKEKKIKLVLHRNSSNKIRNFIKILCNQMNINVQFVFLDDNLYKFVNSQIPQFLKKIDSIKILNTLKTKNNSKQSKIYISRQNCSYRNLINEGDIIDKLKKLNFKIVDLNNLEIIQQIKLFSEADVILSPSGSALTNILFCNKGTKVFEISPKYNFKYEDRFKFRYQFISETLKLNYKRIEAESIDVKNINERVKNTITSKAIKESNYYKDLILQLDKIDKILYS